MSSISRTALVLGMAAYLASPVVAGSIPMTYCARINTASMNGNVSNYQSDGLCHDFCLSSSAYAIVQSNLCFCSDYTPDSSARVSVDQCSQPCPGFPDDVCGGNGLFGYMSLTHSPSGTKSGTAAPTTSDAATTPQATTDQTTPSVTIATVTQGGSVSLQTVTVYPTVTGGTSSGSADGITTTKSISTGAAVGIAIGVLGAVCIAAGLGIFFCLRRRRQQKDQALVDRSNSNRGSSAGMMSTPRTEMASVWDSEAPSVARRNSRLMPHDPRMDPYTANLYNRNNENRSHESINTLRDDQDYSRRVLRTTNPDPQAAD